MATDRTWEVTRAQVRRDFTYLRGLMRDAERVMREIDASTDLTDSGDAYQLALEIAGVAHQFEAWIVSERRKRETAARLRANIEKLRAEGMDGCHAVYVALTQQSAEAIAQGSQGAE